MNGRVGGRSLEDDAEVIAGAAVADSFSEAVGLVNKPLAVLAGGELLAVRGAGQFKLVQKPPLTEPRGGQALEESRGGAAEV